ncbi:MAG: phosphoribosyltransferase [Flavobacteriales bacterium]|nr:MAG: phosphoribosyltransferase [Flavobacteriales bacterium]
MTDTKTQILSHKQVEQKVNRIAHELYENHFEEKDIIMVGIASRGLLLAKRIKKVLQRISPIKVKLLEIKINKGNPLNNLPELALTEKDSKGKTVILVDDVMNSGRTLIYGAKPLLNLPIKALKTVVLVNRRHRQFPIRADFVGITLSTTIQEHISVELGNGTDAVYLT